ncbi:hypothetical protein [Mycobacterium sp.]
MFARLAALLGVLVGRLFSECDTPAISPALVISHVVSKRKSSGPASE